MDVKRRTYQIIKANPVINYDEIVQELNRTLIDELQDCLNELLEEGKVTKRAGHYEVL